MLSSVKAWADLAVSIVVLVGAIAAFIKFRIYNIFGRRWHTDVTCSHFEMRDGSVVFVAEYTIANTGRRPFKIHDVEMRVLGAIKNGPILHPDPERLLAERTVWDTARHENEPTHTDLFEIEPGERSIFTLRARLPELDDIVFVPCKFSIVGSRQTAGFRGFYVTSAGSGGHYRDNARVGADTDE